MSNEIEFDVKIYGTTPEQARHRLDYMGFEEEMWDEIMGNGFDGEVRGSHEVRALITIARGTEPKLLGRVYEEMRQKDGLPKRR